MSHGDWYRNTEWNDEVEEAFFAKLARARSQRDQYLVIQALTIAPHRPDVALRLVDGYFERRKDDFDDMRALLARAEAYRHQGDIASAVKAYKAVLHREAEFPNRRTRTRLELPFLIACDELSAEYDFALSVLEKGLDIAAFPVDYFLWHASKALIASVQGRHSEAREAAVQALEAAQVRRSGFRYHQNLGLVGEQHQQTIKNLIRLAG